MYYVYILRWSRYYVGVTKDINTRMRNHLELNVYSTKRMWEKELVWYYKMAKEE